MSRLVERRNAVVYDVELEFEGIIKTRSLWGKWKYRRWEIFSDGFAKVWASGDRLERIIDLQNAKIIDTRLIDKTMKIELKNPIMLKTHKSSNIWGEIMLKYSGSVNSSLRLESFTSAAVVANRTGAILAVNKLFEELFEYKAEDLIGKNVKILMPPSIAAHHDDYLLQYSKSGKKNLIGKTKQLEGVKSNGTRMKVIINLGVYLENAEINYLATFLPTSLDNADPNVKKNYEKAINAHVLKKQSDCSSDEDEIDFDFDDDTEGKAADLYPFPILYSKILGSSIKMDEIESFSTEEINALATRVLQNGSKIIDDNSLLLACELGNWPIAKKLIERGASVNSVRVVKQSKKDILQTAIDILLSHPLQNIMTDELLRLLIDNGADIRKSQLRSKMQLNDSVSKHFTNEYFTGITIDLAISKQLNSLDLSRCELKSLGFIPISKIVSLSKHITTLDLSNNKIEELPNSFGLFQQLRIFNICNNNLKALPNSLGYLKQLKELIVKNNPLEYPPKNVVKQGCASIVKFLSDQIERMSTSLHLKMMIFGDDKGSINTLVHSLACHDFHKLSTRKKLTKQFVSSLSTSKEIEIKKKFNIQGKMKSEIFRLQKSENDMNMTIFRNSAKPPTPKRAKATKSAPVGFLSFVDDQNVNILQERKTPGDIENVKISLASKDCTLLLSNGEARTTFSGQDLLDWLSEEFRSSSNNRDIAQELLSMDIIQRVSGGSADLFSEKSIYRLTYETEVTVEINCKIFGLDEQNLNRNNYLFTENTIYMILFDLKKGYVEEKLEYWLQYIYSRTQLNSSIIIVGTNSGSIPAAQVEATLIEINKIFSATFNTVKCLTAIDIGTKIGLSELYQIVQTEALQILDNSPPISNSNAIFYDIIKEVRNPPILEFSELQSIGAALKFSNDRLNTFLRYYTQTGLIISFPQSNCDSNLRDYVIVDPNWVSNNPLLSNSLLAFNKGIVKKDDLKMIWKNKEFTENFQNFLMSAFEAFEIFLQIYDDYYVIPFLLSSDFTKFSSFIDNQTHIVQRDVLFNCQNITFQIHRLFQLDYIPPAAIMRLTVRLLEVYSPRDLTLYLSRNSVVFEKGLTHLILEQDESQRLFSISLRCSEKDQHLIVTSLELFRLTIDSWYSIIRYYYHIESTQWVPCNICMERTKKVNIIKGNPLSPQSDIHFFNISTIYGEFAKNSLDIRCNLCGVIPLSDIDFDISYLDIPQISLESKGTNSNTIGKGAYGTVSKMNVNGRYCAVKLFGKLSADQYFEIRREIWIMSKLRFDNIVNIIGTSMNPFGIVMDLAPLGDLYSYLHNPKIPLLSWRLRIKIAMEIARAMAFMHSLTPPVIHRDLKSPNILLYSDDCGSSVSAKVTDFGLSLFLYKDGIREKKNCRDVQTPTWLAPEVIFGDVYTEKSDVYAFGIIMYELLTRKHPFRDMVPRDLNYLVEDLILSGMRPSIPSKFDSEFAPHYSQQYCTLLQEAWSHNPIERPSFNDIVGTLEPIRRSLES